MMSERIPPSEWRWYGTAGHLIVASNCRFHLTTRVGDFMVSTVGEYVPDSAVREIMARSRGVSLVGHGDEREADWMRKVGYEDIGAGREYETMVFHAPRSCVDGECGCGAPTPDEWSELDFDGYNTRGAAQEGHYRMCEKWASASSTTKGSEK